MALPPLASLADLTKRLPRPLLVAQRDRAEAILDDISAEVRNNTGRTWVLPDGPLDPARPDVLAVVTLRAARRAVDNPAELAGETVGTYTRRFPDHGTNREGGYLTDGERRMLAAAVGGGDLVSVPTMRDVMVDDRLWLSDGAGGDLILWADDRNEPSR